MPFIVTAILCFILYLIITSGSGDVLGLWSYEEIIAGVFVSVVAGAISGRFFCSSKNYRMLNPLRWVLLVIYIIPFFIEMARANLDVAMRVITGRINPGIVRISPGLKTDLGMLLLANSITLTPGTLSVEVDEESGDLFVHVINVSEELAAKEIADEKDLFPIFNLVGWIRRIAE
jgi:multicomponent Na+:H+ antiporter subunit E